MRVLVTGATGFIGAAVIRALARKGHEVIAVVRRHDAEMRGCETVTWDLVQAKRPRPLPDKVDAIVHAAQSRNYRAVPPDRADMFHVNVAATYTLLDYAVDVGVSRFCLFSTGTVYEPYRGELREDAALAPAGFLGATKLAAEVLARPYAGSFALSVLRLFFPYGPGQKNRLIPDIIERVRTGSPVQLAADGEGLWIAPTYVEDIAEITATAVIDGWTGTINVASPQIISLRELAGSVGRIVGRLPVFEMTDRESVRIVPVLDRLSKHFDLRRFTPIETALPRVIASTAST